MHIYIGTLYTALQEGELQLVAAALNELWAYFQLCQQCDTHTHTHAQQVRGLCVSFSPGPYWACVRVYVPECVRSWKHFPPRQVQLEAY